MPSLSDIASISATPRSEGWGTLADVLNYVNQNMLQQQFGYRNPVTGLISEVVGIPAAARVAERLAYGQPITNIGKANVPLIPQDTAEAVGLAAPIVGSYGKFAGRQIGKAIDQAMVEGAGPLAKAAIQPLRMAESYRGSHVAPNWENYGAPLHDLTKIMPANVYESIGKQLYGIGDPVIDSQWRIAAIKAKGKPDADIEIYRAVPKGIKDINSGDWVTTSKKYAENHGESTLNGEYDIIKKTVKAKNLSSEGYPYEFGYHEK